MRDVYEGMHAVCAVLADLEPRMPEAPVLRLAERHLRLLAEMLSARPGMVPEAEGDQGAPLPDAGAVEPVRVPAPGGAPYARQ